MKHFYACYDSKDNFICCGYSPSEMGINANTFFSALHRNKGKNKGSIKIYEIPLEVKNDIFKQEDEAFLSFEGDRVFSEKELAEKYKISLRTVQRRKAKGWFRSANIDV